MNDGAQLIQQATGEWPVFPGHALVIAYEILSLYPNVDAALEPVGSGEARRPPAVTDIRIDGAGSEVYAACDLLRMARQGQSALALMAWADARWRDGNAGGYAHHVQAGLAQAEKLKADFPAKLAAWLGAA